jgi:hypothetical protein
MMLVCLVAVVLGSVIGALSTSLLGVILARGMQGMAVALIPIGISIMRDELPGERVWLRCGADERNTGHRGGGRPTARRPDLQPHLDWHSLFCMSAAMGSAMTLAVLLVGPESSLEPDEVQRWIDEDSRNAEVLFRYLNDEGPQPAPGCLGGAVGDRLRRPSEECGADVLAPI